MPKRPRPHVIETESKRAFEKVIPSNWICRWETIDYGIDATVEIVDEETVTGDIFAVQLKGTDRKGANRVRLTYQQILYYTAYPLPVLIVLYRSDDRKVLARWFHEFLHDATAAQRREWQTQQTVSINLSEGFELDRNQAFSLTQTLREELGRRNLRPLLKVLLESDRNQHKSQLGAPPAEKIRKQIFAELETFFEAIAPNRVSLVEDASSDDINLVISISVVDSETIVAISPKKIVSLLDDKLEWHGPTTVIPSWVISQKPKQPLASILLSVGLCLSAKGDPESGCKFLISSILECSDLLEKHPYIYFSSSMVFAAAQRAADALSLAEELLNQGKILGSAYLAAASVFTRETKSSITHSYQNVLQRCIEKARDNIDKATFSYNLANSLRADSKFREAIHFYNLAAKHYPHYRGRHYWWAELAGCLFCTGHFKWSAQCYKKALECQPPGRSYIQDADITNSDEEYNYWIQPYKGPYADALLFAGEYAESLKHFDDYVSSSESPEAEWVLKRYFVSSILETFHLDKQRRNLKSAKEFVDRGWKKVQKSDLVSTQTLVEKAFQEDLLCTEAWILQAKIAELEENLKELVFCQMAVALLTHDLHWWAIASLNSLHKDSGSVVLMLELVRGGYALFSSEFVDYAKELLEKQKNVKPE